MLETFRGKKATMPQDQVVSLTGIISASTGRPHLRPWYTVREMFAAKPTSNPNIKYDTKQQAFMEAACSILSTERSLRLLRHHSLYESNSTPDWPAWLPDWSKPRDDSYKPQMTITNQETFPRSKKNILVRNRHACGARSHPWESGENHENLVFFGHS